MSEENPTAYIPTKKERVILEALLLPENRLKTVEQLCREIGVDKATYYKAFKKPGFMTLYHNEAMDLARKAAGPVVNACMREAVRGSHQHAKIILGMADLYHERRELTGKGGGPIEQKHSIDDLMQEIDGITKDFVKP